MPSEAKESLPGFLAPGRRSSEHFRATDWTATPVGEPDQWPVLLRHCVSLIIETPLPAFVLWGQSLAFLYNAPYVPLLVGREKNPLGQPLPEVWPDLWPDLRQLVESAFAGEPVSLTNVMRPVRRGGNTEQHWFNVSYSPIFAGPAEVAAVLCLIQETTEQVVLERRQSMRLALAEQLSSLDNVAAIQQASARFFGEYLEAHHVFFAQIDDVAGTFEIQTDWMQSGARPLARVTGRMEDFGNEAIAVARSGKPLVVDDVRTNTLTAAAAASYESLGIRSVMSLPHVQDGALLGSVTVYRAQPHAWTALEVDLASDINERIWLAIDRVVAGERLIQADRRKDEFLAMLAHELRNPLAPIASAAELIRRYAAEPGKIEQAGAVIARQVRHMGSLLDDLLDVSRVTRGLARLDMQRVNLRSALEDATEQILPLIESRQHRLEMAMPEGEVSIEGDYKRLVQIIANLLNNAAKYTPVGGVVRAELTAAETTASVSVRDNGIGISRAYLPTIFEPFSQGDRSVDRSQGGLGLGLALVKSLVGLHGGTIAVQSTEGQGSVFTATFPRAPAGTIASPKTAAPESGRGGLQILIVDDNQDAADMLAELLRSHGHEVNVYYLPEPAIAAARSKRFDLLLIDIGLPQMSGFEVAVQIRAGGQSARGQCIAVSGYGQPEDHARALRAGFSALLVKPVAFEALTTILRRTAQANGT